MADSFLQKKVDTMKSWKIRIQFRALRVVVNTYRTAYRVNPAGWQGHI